MTVYCNACNWKIGRVTFENKDRMLLRYAKHIVTHKPIEIMHCLCWTSEKKERVNNA